MTHEELLDCVTKSRDYTDIQEPNVRMVEELNALRAVVELHKPTEYGDCSHCFGLHSMGETYPCPTIQAIEKELG
jgi:hypothetical protein